MLEIPSDSQINQAPKMIKLSRRGFLGLSALAGLIAAGIHNTGHLQEQEHDWNVKALVPNQNFYDIYIKPYGNLRLGTSFSIEQARHLGLQPLTTLVSAVEDFGIRDIRLGLRWSEIAPNGKIDLKPYRDCLEYCLQNNIETCLNNGPIKCFRWEEEFVPPKALSELSEIPPKNSVIKPGSELANMGLEYLNNLGQSLTGEYGADLLQSKVKTVQADNEPFNPFGKNRWTMHPDFILQTIEVLDKYFPKSQLLFNSAGILNVGDISGLFDKLSTERPGLVNRLVYGLDHYDQIPGISDIRKLGQIDEFSLAKILHQPLYPQSIPNLRRIISELQTEGWGNYQLPGNSVQHLRYNLLRSLREYFLGQSDSLIMLWGMELLVKKFQPGQQPTPDHYQIAELIMTINKVPHEVILQKLDFWRKIHS